MSNAAAGPLAAIENGRYISLATFRKSGEPVLTPVEFVTREGAIYVRTGAVSGKVKRLRRNPRVRVAACTMRGRTTGPPFDGVAALLSDAEMQVLYALFAQKYGVLFRLGSMLRRRPMIGLRIMPDGQPPAA